MWLTQGGRLGHIAAAAVAAASASASVATSRGVRVGGRIPPVPAVAVLITAVVVIAARVVCPSWPAASGVGSAAAAAASGAGCNIRSRWRSPFWERVLIHELKESITNLVKPPPLYPHNNWTLIPLHRKNRPNILIREDNQFALPSHCGRFRLFGRSLWPDRQERQVKSCLAKLADLTIKDDMSSWTTALWIL